MTVLCRWCGEPIRIRETPLGSSWRHMNGFRECGTEAEPAE